MPATIFEFGEFRLDCGRFELLRNGRRLKLERKPLELLILLAERNGQLATREEIAKRLWQSEVFVDTEHGINTAIRKIRLALRDDPEDARFIQTVTGKGYRLAAPVEVLPDKEPATPASETRASGNGAAHAEPLQAPTSPVSPEPKPVSQPAKQRRVGLAIGGCAAAMLLAGGLWMVSRPLPPPRIAAYTQLTHDGKNKDGGLNDGNRIYLLYTSPKLIAQMDIAGGEVVTMPLRIPDSLNFPVDLSPDGSELLVETYSGRGKDDDLWKVHVLGGSARRIGKAAFGTFAPDGKSILYSTGLGEIFLAGSDGSAPRKLASPGGIVVRPVLSPDGERIRYEKDQKLWEMSADGVGAHLLLPDWHAAGEQVAGAWTPDGAIYLFLMRSLPPGGDQIWALDERRRRWPWQKPPAPIQLTNGPIHWQEPIPSRDGKKIFAAGQTHRGELTRLDTKSGHVEPFLNGISAEFVTFSRDGKSVAYVTFPEGILWKANRDGSGKVQLTEPPLYPMVPQWSPDGKQIVFVDGFGTGPYAIYTVAADGGNREKVLAAEDAVLGDPTWSSDGRKIPFYHNTTEMPRTDEIRVLDLESRRVEPLPGSQGMFSPRWSPNGRYILGVDRETAELRVLDTETRKWSVAKTNGPVSFPSFSSDSKTIYFLRYGSDQGVYRAPASGGMEERVADMRDLHLAGVAGMSLSLDPTDSLLFLRDTGSNDLYALTLEER